MKRTLLAVILLFILLLSACTSTTAPAPADSPSASTGGIPEPPDATADDSQDDTAAPAEYDGVSDLIPYLDSPENVYAHNGHTSYKSVGHVFAIADAGQAEKIIALLSEIDLSVYTEKDSRAGMGGGAAEFKIEGASESCVLTVLRNAEDSYLLFDFSIGKSRYFEGPEDAINMPELNQAQTDVLGDTDDLENMAEVTYLDGSAENRYVNKGGTALLQDILDGAAAMTHLVGDPDNYTFEIKITIRGRTYWIDPSTGVFLKEQDGETTLSRLEENWLMVCAVNGGFYDYLPAEAASS